MRQYERGGVTVDQCTECRGIFLDRGELDRLIDAENAWHKAAPPPMPQQPPVHPGAQPRYRDYDSDEYPMYGRGGHGGSGKRKKRGGFLGELFD
ncbi:MAG: zf-TFIIB domain-containing protein [Natronosporangium sp.]